MKIGIVTRDKNTELARILKTLTQLIVKEGSSVLVSDEWKRWGFKRRSGVEFLPLRRLVLASSCILSLGGDGTVIKIVHALRGKEIPIAGVNFGRFGFLTPFVYSQTFLGWLRRVLKKKTVITLDQRSLLDVSFSRLSKRNTHLSLNEVLIHSLNAQLIHIDCFIDSKFFTTFVSDGVITASPTGSTAYALSAGGPLIDPRVRSLLIVPLNPHVLSNRPIVIPEGVQVLFRLHPESRGNAVVWYDGVRKGVLTRKETVAVSVSSRSAFFVRSDKGSFLFRLTNKLSWNMR